MTTNDLIWLAGFMDADGSISIVKASGYHVLVQVAGTDPRNRDKILQVYQDCGIRFTIADVKTDQRGLQKGRTNHARAWNIVVQRKADSLKLLQLLAPYMVGKKDRAELCIPFLERRLKSTGRGASAAPYTEEDEWTYNEVKRLQRSYKEFASV